MPNFDLVAVAQKLRSFDSGFVVITGDNIGQPYYASFFVHLVGPVLGHECDPSSLELNGTVWSVPLFQKHDRPVHRVAARSDDPRQVCVRVRFAHTARFGEVCTPDEVARTRNDFIDAVVAKHRRRGAD